MKIILFQPQIPQNTGNIVRTCSATGADLLLVRPLGFSTQNRHLKRAGLDYWEGVNVQEIDDLPGYLEKETAPFFFFSSHAEPSYTEARFTSNSLLIFGSETEGLPPSFVGEVAGAILHPPHARRHPLSQSSQQRRHRLV